MPGRYRVRLRADLDIDEVADYIGQRNAGAGRRFIQAVQRDCDFLAANPAVGSIRARVPERLKGLRSWPITGFRNYLIFYLPGSDGIEIVRVLHGARDVDRVIEES